MNLHSNALPLTSPYAGRSTREARRVGGCRNDNGAPNSTTAVPTRQRADARCRPPRKGEVSGGGVQ
jgi:hypothetical protein